MADPAFALRSTDDFRQIAGPSARLTFRRFEGRWTHEVAFGPSATALAQAVEHDPARDDPSRLVSPAYQEFHWQPDLDAARSFLTGQLTPHHFSAVVTPHPEPGGASIEFDVAGRSRAEIVAFACTYDVDADPGALVDAGPSAIAWESPDAWGPGRLEFAVEPPGAVVLGEGTRRGVRVQALAPLTPGVHTRRCVYRWRWTTG